jgi:hypothetical protein
MCMDPETSQESRRHLEMLAQQISGHTNELWLCGSKNGDQRCIRACIAPYGLPYVSEVEVLNYTDNHSFLL